MGRVDRRGGRTIILILFFDVNTLATIIGTVVAIEFVLISLSAIVARIKFPNMRRPYRMPIWPVIPAFAALFAIFLVTLQAPGDLLVAGIIVAVSLLYWLVYLRPAQQLHLRILDPIYGDSPEGRGEIPPRTTTARRSPNRSHRISNAHEHSRVLCRPLHGSSQQRGAWPHRRSCGPTRTTCRRISSSLST